VVVELFTFALVFWRQHLANFSKLPFAYLRRIEYLVVFFIALNKRKRRFYLKVVIAALVGVPSWFQPTLLGFPAFLTMNEEFAKVSPSGGNFALTSTLLVITPSRLFSLDFTDVNFWGIKDGGLGIIVIIYKQWLHFIAFNGFSSFFFGLFMCCWFMVQRKRKWIIQLSS
jgi:hypothetical protein